MNLKVLVAPIFIALAFQSALAAEPAPWWNAKWRFRTTVARPSPADDAAPRPAEVAIDFGELLTDAGARGEFDPASVRVVRDGREIPSVLRTGLNPREQRNEQYVSWIAQPDDRGLSGYDIYFETRERAVPVVGYAVADVPPENLLFNAGFDGPADSLRPEWLASNWRCVDLGRYAHTDGRDSMKVYIDERTDAAAPDEIELWQAVDARGYRGQEMLFQCDLFLAEGQYGLPVQIQLQQFREDGSQILEYAVEPRWLTIELARGQLVQFDERGRFSPDIAELRVRVRVRGRLSDADTGRTITGPERYFTLFMDRFVVRPGERWSWPPPAAGPYVTGGLEDAPLNEGIHFSGIRRVIFCGRSAGSLTTGQYNPDPRSVHWGREQGTVEFWLRPDWDADDGQEHVFFFGSFYVNKHQSRVRKRGADGGNALEFTIVDADNTVHTASGDAPIRADQWHHIAGTWDFARGHLQLFCDGKLIGSEGPSEASWTSSGSRTACGTASPSRPRGSSLRWTTTPAPCFTSSMVSTVCTQATTATCGHTL